MPNPPKLEVVEGGQAHTKTRKEDSDKVRVVFIPGREDTGPILVEQETFYAMELSKPVAVTIDRSAVCYVPVPS